MNRFNIMKNITEVRKAILFIVFVIFIIVITSSCSSISDTQNDIPSNTYTEIDTEQPYTDTYAEQIEPTVQPQTVDENKNGNTHENISLGNNVVSWRGKIYYLQSTGGYINLFENYDDLSKPVSYRDYLKNEIADKQISNLNVYNDELYFVQDTRIIKMDRNNKLELVYGHKYNIYKMVICNDRIIFSDSSDDLISMNLDSSDYKVIINDVLKLNFYVYDNTIYVGTYSLKTYYYYLKSYDVFGNNQKDIVTTKIDIINFRVYDNSIYFYDTYKDTDLKGTTQNIYLIECDLNGDMWKITKLGGYYDIKSTFFITQDGSMFFYNDKENKILSLDLETQTLKTVLDIESEFSSKHSLDKFLGYIDGYVYCLITEKYVGSFIYRTNGNGT